MEGLMLVLAVVGGCASTVIGSELRPIRIIGTQQGQGHQYILTYTSSRPPVVLWGNADGRYYTKDDAEVTSFFDEDTGQGESTLIIKTSDDKVIMALVLNDTTSYYSIKKFVGDKELPEVDLAPMDGKVLTYSPGQPFTVRLRYNNIPSSYNLDKAMWFFNFIDHYRMTPILEKATVFDGRLYGRYMSPIATETIGNYQEVSTELNFESQEGQVVAMLEYSNADMQVFRTTTFAIKQTNSTGPFPDNFLGVTPLLTGGSKIYCTNSICNFMCDGFGGDIEKVEVRRVSDGQLVEPLYTFNNDWSVSSEYQLYPVTDFTERYVCTATNTRNESAQKEMTLFTND